ncbi:MAG: alpha/beta hydrolase [Myxococcaceae bacterium]|nr:alpha/beta hydrolase [Myxococcaceae bacterium]
MSIFGATALCVRLAAGLLAASAVPPASVSVTRDLVYGEDPTLQSLDVYSQEGEVHLPVVVFIHGGGWAEGDKGVHLRKGSFFVHAGFVYVTLNYRLSPAVTHPAHAEDVARALGWVREHIADYGGDPTRIFLLGHSAGAQLAALVATDPRYLALAGLKVEDVRGVALLDGSGYDLVTRVPLSRGWSRTMYLQAFGSDPKVWADASPVRHIEKGRPLPPFLLFHIDARRASATQAVLLASAVNAAGGSAEVVPVTGRNHATIVKRLGLPGDPVGAQLLRWMRARLR